LPGRNPSEVRHPQRSRAQNLESNLRDSPQLAYAMWSRSLDFWRLVRPYWKLLVVAVFALLVESITGLWEPWPLKLIFDHVIGANAIPAWLARVPVVGNDRLAVLNVAAAAVIGIAAIGAAASYTQKYLSTAVGQHVMHDLRHTLYHHVQRLSLSFFEQRRTGDMVVRLTSDIDAAQDFISSALLGIMMDVVTLLGMLAVMLYLDWRFTLLSMLVAPLLFVVVYRRTRRIKTVTREAKRKESDLASVVQESISAIRVVKAFAREDYEERRLDEESQAAMDVALRARSIKAGLPSIVDVIVAGGTCLVLLVGVRLVLAGQLTSGTLLVFVLYLGKMYKPMKDLSKMTDTLSRASVGFERIGELLKTESQVCNLAGARPAPPFQGRIEFERVQFGYEPGHLVLKGIDLVAEPGRATALVGATGSGKSTLISLIPRFYDVLGGRVCIDGRDVRSVTLKSLRDQISIVPQDPVLFHGPVWHNIAYGKPDATHEEIVRAAKMANAHEFITRMPRGYDTIVGERGDTLSGGERQRIAIARAVIRQTPILLMDEPSAALDAESEELIFAALTRLMEGRTSITIAHRMSTIRRADVIYVIDEGGIKERGTHEQLLASSKLYARLYRMQFRNGHPIDHPGTVPAIV
jgi:subfamily B ATP-binding cassette protein MsbA